MDVDYNPCGRPSLHARDLMLCLAFEIAKRRPTHRYALFHCVVHCMKRACCSPPVQFLVVTPSSTAPHVLFLSLFTSTKNSLVWEQTPTPPACSLPRVTVGKQFLYPKLATTSDGDSTRCRRFFSRVTTEKRQQPRTQVRLDHVGRPHSGGVQVLPELRKGGIHAPRRRDAMLAPFEFSPE